MDLQCRHWGAVLVVMWVMILAIPVLTAGQESVPTARIAAAEATSVAPIAKIDKGDNAWMMT
ncbi:MAG: hypothetical protein WCH75_28135, partial [Candidatus Binatia bacterium]